MPWCALKLSSCQNGSSDIKSSFPISHSQLQLLRLKMKPFPCPEFPLIKIPQETPIPIGHRVWSLRESVSLQKLAFLAKCPAIPLPAKVGGVWTTAQQNTWAEKYTFRINLVLIDYRRHRDQRKEVIISKPKRSWKTRKVIRMANRPWKGRISSYLRISSYSSFPDGQENGKKFIELLSGH